jgi:hypothetical protein
MTNQKTVRDTTRTITNLIVIIFVLTGIALIAVSVVLPREGTGGYWREFLKELGIVILSVFTVSLLYERIVANRHLGEFSSLLTNQIHQIETNAAACAKLGIQEIFPTRDLYEIRYPFSEITSNLVQGSDFQVTGRSLFQLLTKTEAIKRAVERGVSVKLCLFDPDSPASEVAKLPDLELSDITAAISTFKKNLAEWVVANKPQGSIELRFHQVHMFDSYLKANVRGRLFGVWDINLGRDTSSKRILIVEANRGLGADLSKRYDIIWNSATPAFKYQNGSVAINNL